MRRERNKRGKMGRGRDGKVDKTQANLRHEESIDYSVVLGPIICLFLGDGENKRKKRKERERERNRVCV